jgi:hypothetical protein
MGACYSFWFGHEFTPKQQEIIAEYRDLFKGLGFNRSQKNRLSKLFWELDDDHSGSISFTEFSNCSGIGKTKFTKNAFCLLDVNHDGGLSFPEFIVCIWHFCTILPQDLPGLAYECYVREDEPGIHTDTLLKLVDEAMGVLSGTNAHGYDGREHGHNVFEHHQRGNDPNSHFEKELRALEKLSDPNGYLSRAKFTHYLHNHDLLLKKTIVFHHEIRHKILGAREWSSLGKKRRKWLKGVPDVTTKKMVRLLQKRCNLDDDFEALRKKHYVPHSERHSGQVKKSKPKRHDLNAKQDESVMRSRVIKGHKLSKYVVRGDQGSKNKRAGAKNHPHEKHHHHAATSIQKHIRRKLTEKKRRDGQLHPHNVAIGGGWTEYWDKETDSPYFYNKHTKITQREWPRDIPHTSKEAIMNREEWKTLKDKKTGKLYYYNGKTKCTTWQKPWAN